MPNKPGNGGTASGDNKPAPTNAAVQMQNVTLTLYFPSANGDSVVPEQRLVQVNQGEMLEEVIFHQLQKGSLSSDTGAIIPKGTKLLSIGTKEVSALWISPLSLWTTTLEEPPLKRR